MWKVEGQPGFVELFLDHFRGHVLRGDFDVSLRFELGEFPIPRSGHAELQLQVFARTGGKFGTMRVVARDGRLQYEGSYHVEARQAPFEGRAGGLRMRRRGNRIEFLYHAQGEWHVLLVRPEVNGVPDMLFAVRLISDAEEGYVVSFDDLAASSTPWPTGTLPR